MKKLLFTRRYNKETYTYYLHKHNGELGILGVPQYSYITCETPDNGLGYTDTVLLSSHNVAYTINRYLQPWILKTIEKVMLKLSSQYC